MAWTYTGDPAHSALDEVRFLIGDITSTESWTLQDEEINYLIAQSPSNVTLAAARAAEAVCGKFARMQASKTIGDLSISWSNRYSDFKELAGLLKSRATLKAVSVYATGFSRADKAAADAETDRIAPVGRVDGMNNVGSVTEATDDTD